MLIEASVEVNKAIKDRWVADTVWDSILSSRLPFEFLCQALCGLNKRRNTSRSKGTVA